MICLLRSGKAGDVADARGPAGNAAQWLPPKGVLSWHHVPGHAPGQVSEQGYYLMICKSWWLSGLTLQVSAP